MAGEFLARFDNVAAEESYNHIVIHKKLWEEQGFNRRKHSGKIVPAHAAAINEILDLPEDQSSIYQLMEALEDIDYNAIKDALCLPGTEWNITGKNPRTVSRPNLLPEAKLWNTIMKRNHMPTSHNQTVDRKRHPRLPCLISALCRREAVPTFNNDKYTIFHTGWEHKHYMKKMDVADTVPIQGSFVAAPSLPPPTADPQPSPAHSTEAPSLYIMQLRNQPQRIEARQMEFIAESKVFQTTLLQFLYDHFLVAKFPPAPNALPASPAAANFVASPSSKAGETEEIHYSSNVEPDAFDWNTPHDPLPSAPAPPTDIESSIARKRKAPVARVIQEDTSPEPTADPPTQASPAKRRRRLHILTTNSDDDGSDDPTSSKSLAY
ncbi:hypothetical protein V6N12_028882 [Hibiscus sabdariffa]|uniref:Uncharacterized protein n=1 Tax=Hibiscus sabdariffa TaxID=183260 RepID=A0ABR2F728_9ROSI